MCGKGKVIATLTCPFCGHRQRKAIPKESCLPFYQCRGCGELISAKSCCVFCDYSNKPCSVAKLANAG